MAKSRVNILVALPTHGVFGGMEIFALALANWIDSQEGYKARVCFKLVGDSDFSEPLRDQCQKMDVDFSVYRKGDFRIFKELLWCDLLHLNNLSAELGVMSKMLQKPLVTTIHNWNKKAGTMQGIIWRMTFLLANYRTYNSNFVRKSWTSLDFSTRDERIPTVSNLSGKIVPFVQRKGFFFIARWIENKGIEVLVEAYSRARIDKATWPLVLAGDGPKKQAILRLIESTDSDGIQVLGRISDDQKFAAIAQAKWVVCAPHTQEDLGLTPIEARYLAVPVIASFDGGVPESAGPSAIFVPPADIDSLSRALELAAALPELEYERRSQEGQLSLSTFLKPLDRYGEIYDSLIK